MSRVLCWSICILFYGVSQNIWNKAHESVEYRVFICSLCVCRTSFFALLSHYPPTINSTRQSCTHFSQHTVHGTGKRREEKTGPADDKQSKIRKKKNSFLMFIFFSSTSNYCANKLLKSVVTTESITCFFLNYTFHLFVTRSLEKTGKLMILNLRRRMEEFFTKFNPQPLIPCTACSRWVCYSSR